MFRIIYCFLKSNIFIPFESAKLQFMNPTLQRLSTLRQMMRHSAIAACIIPSSDPHLSEYVAGHWKRREWLSGFDGSAGTVVVLQEQAGLWTDSRYFLQAEMQLADSGISLFKEGLPGVPDYSEQYPDSIHGQISAFVAREVFAIRDHGVLDAVFAHQQCTVDMSNLTRIIKIADVTEPNRDFRDAAQLRKQIADMLAGGFFRRWSGGGPYRGGVWA